MDITGLVKTNLAVVQNTIQSQTYSPPQKNANGTSSVAATKLTKASQSLQNSTNAASMNKNDVKSLVEKLNSSISTLNNSVKFSYSEDAKALVVKVVDSKTGQVIRQIPPEELIKLEASLAQSIGIVFNKEVK
ncbi:Flagellin protein FlaG [Desulfurella amilsii]|uniref:Flagellin protein FlaG n=1 Tax=Desulfurella amilsii TaxID=1562698 RepID=A0A1X4XYH5_9BACT|nr:flagellar protein FlaG [Desulfurella amilsii]OSS42591.1 Flagellin protein FlaG [Desulfurella amilsii]